MLLINQDISAKTFSLLVKATFCKEFIWHAKSTLAMQLMVGANLPRHVIINLALHRAIIYRCLLI